MVAINKLPVKQRMIFKMKRFMGLSYEKIADKMGISKNTVKVQLVRANKSLKKELGSYVEMPT
jgi:RNA polymerase sigma-70 factor (ECF subfamily)